MMVFDEYGISIDGLHSIEYTDFLLIICLFESASNPKYFQTLLSAGTKILSCIAAIFNQLTN